MARRRRPPTGLDAAELAVWRAFIEGSQLVRHTIERDLERSDTVAPGYYGILVALSEAPGRRLRMGELADATLSSPSRLSHAVGKLERAGLVERTACGVDGRGLDAVLTDAGLAALESAVPVAANAVRAHFLDAMTPDERAVVGAVFERIRQRVRADMEASGCPERAGVDSCE